MSNADEVKSKLEDTLIEDSKSKIPSLIEDAKILSLGIIWHPDVRRIGEVSKVIFDAKNELKISRLTPLFGQLSSVERTPILDNHVSRTPMRICQLKHGVFKFGWSKTSINLAINGRTVQNETVADFKELGDEIIISIANTVVLSLFHASASAFKPQSRDLFGFYGISQPISRVRGIISEIANTGSTVLIRGETGTGKELVANALHKSGQRAGKNLISVNMATLSPELAAAELFGVKKGAFTGATQDKSGLFERADGGVLFLDEIGETPAKVQPMLLRALEIGEIRPVGGSKSRTVDPWIIAATDRDLDSSERGASFNKPLLQRLEGLTIDIPPLRHRRVDIGILLKSTLSDAEFQDCNFCANQMTEFALHSWPGNVRELQNKARKKSHGLPLEILDHSISPNEVEDEVEKRVPEKPENQRTFYVRASEVDETALIDALNQSSWIIKDAAKFLGVSRTTLYELMERSEQVRKVDEIPVEELRETMIRVPGGMSAWTKHLRVGRHALERRLRTLPKH